MRDYPSIFLGISFPTSPLISLIFMTSQKLEVGQIGLRHKFNKILIHIMCPSDSKAIIGYPRIRGDKHWAAIYC